VSGIIIVASHWPLSIPYWNQWSLLKLGVAPSELVRSWVPARLVVVAFGHNGGSGVFRVLVILALAFGLAGCGLAMQREQQQKLAAANQQLKEASEACQASFSEERKDAIARAKCFNDADRAFMPFSTAPDLVNLRMAKRSEVAERMAQGKITRAQAVLELNELNSNLVSEDQRRRNANQSAAAQQQAATAATIGAINAGAPRTCTRYGNTVNCY